MNLMAAEGVKFMVNAHVGTNITTEQLVKEHDSVLLAAGATKPRCVRAQHSGFRQPTEARI